MLVVWASGFAASGDIFTLVTAESELKAGDVIIIVNQEEKKALSTNQKTNNRGATLVTISGNNNNNVTSSGDTQEITLEGASGAWYFNVGNGYLYADGSDRNRYLKTKIGGKNGDYSKAAIVITSTKTTITFQGKNTNKKLQYNSQSNLFSCYSTTQKAVAIYKKTATKTLKSLAISGDATKKAYNDGDVFDPTGLVVTGTYDDASTEAIKDGITWGTTPATLTVGTTSCSVTATVNGVTSPAYEVTGLTVTKAITLSIDPAIYEVVKAPVKVTLTATHGATIYYTLNGDAPSTSSTKYDAPFEVTKSGTTVKALAVADGAENATAEATYTIKPEQPVFSEESKTFKDAFNVTLSLPESTDANSTIHYAIGETAKADSPLYNAPVNISAENDGDKVILHAVVVDQYGNVGMEKFCTYTKTTSYVFDFTGDWEGITPLEVNDVKGNENAANVVAGKELNVNGIVMTATNGKTLTTCLYGDEKDHNLRVYSEGGSITFTAPGGYNISEVTFDNNSANFTETVGTYSKGTWTGNAHVVTFNANKGVKLNTATIKLVAIANTPLSLDEKAETSVTEKALKDANTAGSVYDVTLTRTLTANVWNTICLPFDVTAEQIANVLKSAGNVKEFDREDATKQTIYFKDLTATTMTAGVPYLIKPTESATELVFKGVKITATEADASLGEKYGVCGTFVPYKLSTDGTDLFLKTDGKFYVPAVGKETMKGFRAYFIAPKNTAGAALNLSFGEATGIDGVAADAVKNVKVYNVNGQYVGTSLDALPKGLYIVGGKKVLK